MDSETQTQTYRENNGRTFQAANNHYILPADNREFARLDAQHHAIKLTQGEVNYLAPLAELLNAESPDETEKKVLDVGCGSGIWIVEMAAEFPKVSCLGVDLAPNWAGRPEVPSNAKFEQCNAVEGIPYPDNTFDVVHSRLLVSGIRDWKTLMVEMIRVLKPNGIIVSIETSATWPVLPNTKEVNAVLPIEEARARAPGHVLFVEKMGQAAIGHGMDPNCGTVTIPALMTEEFGLKDHVKVDYNVPFWEWPEDALLKKAGKSMRHDAEEFPDTLAALIMHGANLTQEEYNPIKQGFLDCIGKQGCYTAMSYHYNYAVKKSVVQDVTPVQDVSPVQDITPVQDGTPVQEPISQ